MSLSFSHFTSVLIFATCASIVFGITQRATTRAMVRYGATCWVGFVGAVIVVSWLMYFVRK
jgi:hypothetical protein